MTDEPLVKLHVIVDPVSPPSPPKKWWEHPVLRALGAFLLTTVLASSLGACWQSRHWAEQQAYAARNETAKARLDLTNSVVRRVSEAFSASNQLVYLTIFTHGGILAKTRDERLRASLEDWLAQNRKWRVEEKVLLAETKATFSNRQVGEILAQIIENGNRLFKFVTEFIEVSGGRTLPPAGDHRRTQLEDINQNIYNVVVETTGPKGLLPRLSDLMIQEARSGQQMPTGWLGSWF